MKTLLVLLSLTMIAALPFEASAHEHWGWQRYHHEPGYWHHGWHDGRFGWWFVNGFAWGYFAARPVYEPSTVIVQEPIIVQPVTTVMTTSPPQPQPGANYYFCPAANSYYPAVKECSGGWVVTPAAPPYN